MDLNTAQQHAQLNETKTIDPLGDGISSLELVRVSGSDLDIVNAARVSYGKFSTEISERDKKLIHFLMEHRHTSPFEHNQLSFRVKAPIFIARQWFRHRMNSYNEISYRFVKSALEFYIPQTWRQQDTVNKQSSLGNFHNEELLATYKKSLDQAVHAYEALLAAGVAREQARALLPVCTYTEFIFTCNLHSLMHFMKLRMHAGAQWEIRRFAQGLLYLAEPHFKESLAHWKKIEMAGIPQEAWDINFVNNLSGQ
ncbi:MAG TPA: FAD-dependent thymidylate synthase [Candidatus Babeliales bacterium]|nr:FAD-dependent thymidylate synthase [Candidatus Babeliales bacterium]